MQWEGKLRGKEFQNQLFSWVDYSTIHWDIKHHHLGGMRSWVPGGKCWALEAFEREMEIYSWVQRSEAQKESLRRKCKYWNCWHIHGWYCFSKDYKMRRKDRPRCEFWEIWTCNSHIQKSIQMRPGGRGKPGEYGSKRKKKMNNTRKKLYFPKVKMSQ